MLAGPVSACPGPRRQRSWAAARGPDSRPPRPGWRLQVRAVANHGHKFIIIIIESCRGAAGAVAQAAAAAAGPAAGRPPAFESARVAAAATASPGAGGPTAAATPVTGRGTRTGTGPPSGPGDCDSVAWPEGLRLAGGPAGPGPAPPMVTVAGRPGGLEYRVLSS